LYGTEGGLQGISGRRWKAWGARAGDVVIGHVDP
jgi:hypothetical protein